MSARARWVGERGSCFDLPFILVLACLAELGVELKWEILDGEVDLFGGRRGAEFLERFESERDVRDTNFFFNGITLPKWKCLPMSSLQSRYHV